MLEVIALILSNSMPGWRLRLPRKNLTQCPGSADHYTLPDGCIRYYAQEVPARIKGSTRGTSFATEFDPKTGSTRQRIETQDHSGEVIRVHPKSIDGQPVDAQHYLPTGVEVKS